MQGTNEPPTISGRLLYKNQWTKLLYRWKGSVTTFGITGALGVVWLFDVQLSDYLKYVPIFKKRFGDQH
uniref:Uncharacterized protein n=1 Tax=Magallana gigas TaxID=29159 RepID=A0A8W8HLD2_MAGGI